VVAHQLKLLSEQGVIWMGYSKSLSPVVIAACS
jgi:hypothetical protein